tara:strand:+ start:54234 stop:54506 length:273 start_codon:yes stop_codon:yes gene_type:complete
MNIIVFLLVGLLAGWIASSLMRGEGLGILADIIVGVIGAFVGGFIFEMAGVGIYGFWSALGMSVIGAMVFLFIVGLFSGTLNTRHTLRKF